MTPMWTVWRQDDNGNRFRMSDHEDRIEALARVLTFEAGPVHKQTYWVSGPPGPTCRTNGDLYGRLVTQGRRMNASGRSLDEFLRAWWLVSRPLADRDRLDLDTLAVMITAAATVTPPPTRPGWRTGQFPGKEEPTSYADWEAIVLSQIADLADFADEGPLDQYAYGGVNAPRPPDRVRATYWRWYNHDPQSYLECGAAGSLGGWDDAADTGETGETGNAGETECAGKAGGARVAVPGPVVSLTAEPGPEVRETASLNWGDLAELARCGQEYE
ncbi:hypothetical protein ACI2K4_26220 [Micromonospora sp. NPDC050397]|uniref:hypothetical protein n=1 Tax=Micromonospora sp. NPDC050397 TaxID=3364279 RepID=UPI00384CACA4